MKENKIDRRLFIKSTTLAATGLAIAGNSAFSAIPAASKVTNCRAGRALTFSIIFHPTNPANIIATGQQRMI